MRKKKGLSTLHKRNCILSIGNKIQTQEIFQTLFTVGKFKYIKVVEIFNLLNLVQVFLFLKEKNRNLPIDSVD